MPPIDSPSTDAALHAFKRAWSDCQSDYAMRRINCEHTLQSSLYHHLRNSAPDDFVLFTEAVIGLPLDDTDKRRKVVIDLLVCKDTEIILAVELKYTPRVIPSISGLKKDVKSLSLLRNRRSIADRVTIEMPRYRSSSAEEMTLAISPLRKLILGVYCQSEHQEIGTDSWWLSVKPDEDFWANTTILPRNLGIAIAGTTDEGLATCGFLGGPFTRLPAE